MLQEQSNGPDITAWAISLMAALDAQHLER